jgi:hypothetical protein
MITSFDRILLYLMLRPYDRRLSGLSNREINSVGQSLFDYYYHRPTQIAFRALPGHGGPWRIWLLAIFNYIRNGVWLDKQTAANWILKEMFRSQSWGDVISNVASHDGAANTPQSVEEDTVNFRHDSAEEEEFDGKSPGLAQAGN